MVRPQQAKGSSFSEQELLKDYSLPGRQGGLGGFPSPEHHGVPSPGLDVPRMQPGWTLSRPPTAAGTALDMKESCERPDKDLETAYGGRGRHQGQRGLSESLHRIGNPLCSFN